MIVVSTGMQSYNPLEEKLEGKIPIYIIGDAENIGDAQGAIKSAYQISSEL